MAQYLESVVVNILFTKSNEQLMIYKSRRTVNQTDYVYIMVRTSEKMRVLSCNVIPGKTV